MKVMSLNSSEYVILSEARKYLNSLIIKDKSLIFIDLQHKLYI